MPNKQSRIFTIDSSPLIKADSLVRLFLEQHTKKPLRLWEEFALMLPEMPAWALLLLVNGKYEVDEQRNVVIKESAIDDLEKEVEQRLKLERDMARKLREKQETTCPECEESREEFPLCEECGECSNCSCSCDEEEDYIPCPRCHKDMDNVNKECDECGLCGECCDCD